LCLVGTAFNIVLLGGITFGWIPDLGLYRGGGAPLAQRLFTLAIVPAVYLVTIWQARLSRRATHLAMDRLDEALRLARQREAQLEEANHNLDVALDAAAGGEGRFSGALAGRFRLAEVVGRGAFGEVYAATDEKNGERAAVKMLLPRVRHNIDLVRRFLREAEALSRFRAPNVVSVYQVGEVQSGAPYIAMELLEGNNLAWHLRRHRQLEPRQVVWMAHEVATGLYAAHAAGIVHRDIKPQNLFLARQDDRSIWKILDFGVAKLGGVQETLTHGAVIGTPGYMSPEQARGQDADPRSDVFSLAAVVYRALAGRPPFANRDTPQLLFDIAYRIPSRPTELAPTLPGDVDLVLAIGLAKRPEDRFGGVVELASALEAALRDQLQIPLRARGQALVDAQPWGRVVTQG